MYDVSLLLILFSSQLRSYYFFKCNIPLIIILIILLTFRKDFSLDLYNFAYGNNQ